MQWALVAVQAAVAAGGGARKYSSSSCFGRVSCRAAALSVGGAASGAGGAGRSCGWAWVEEQAVVSERKSKGLLAFACKMREYWVFTT